MSERYRTTFISTFKMLMDCRLPHKPSKQQYHGSYLYYYNKKELEAKRIKRMECESGNNLPNDTLQVNSQSMRERQNFREENLLESNTLDTSLK